MKKFLIFCWMLLVSTALTQAQIANNTSLVGNVLDQSGGAIPGVAVTAVEVSTKVRSTTKANADGYYAITFIAPGTYNISVDQSGFKKMTKTGVVVPNDQAVRTDFVLEVGSTDVTVTVSADTPPLSTDDATLGETFDATTVQAMPLSSHNAMDDASLAPNVFIGSKTSYSGNPPGEDIEGAGQREIQNAISLDGVSVVNNLITTTPDHVSTDMVSETQIQSGNYSAQYGSYLGVHVNMVSKNGTNTLHGEGYDYVENTALNAYPFTAAPGSIKPVLHYNQWGFNAGGPVYLPRLYNGHDKTFFFGSFEKLSQIGQGSSIVSVLTPAMENGDFSAYLPTQLYDPSNGGAAVTVANGYPGNNVFKSSELSPVAKAYEAFMVAPNQSGISNNLNNSYPANLIIKQTIDRIDENIGDKIKLFGRFYWQNLTFTSGTNFAANASSGPTNSRNWAFGYTHTISPSLINDLRIGVNKLIAENLNYWYVKGLSNAGTRLGIPGFTGDTAYGNPGVPVLSISNFQGVGNAGSNWFQDDRTYDLYEQLSYRVGRHNLMAGFELRRLTLGREATNNPDGVINFSGGSSALTSTGNGAADFVLGYINNDTTPIDTLKGSVKQWRDGFYVLDNWQVADKLTINYGLRYDMPLVVKALNGYSRELNQAQTALTPASTATSGAAWTPAPGIPLNNGQHDNIGPRLGLDYRLSSRAVIRAGAGFYYNANQLNTYTLLTSNYPFAAAVGYTTSNAAPLTFANPTAGSGSASPVAGVAGTYVAAYTPQYNMKTQRNYQWNLDFGYQLWRGAAVEAQYLGSHALHLDRSYYNNEPINPVATSIKSLNSQRPNQLFGSIRVFQEDEFSNYNGLTIILRQRQFHGISGQLGYTWSHALDESPDSNAGGTTSQQYNPRADYGNANWDVRNRVTGELVYALPTMQGHNLLTREALGGWSTSWVVNIQSGMPFTIAMASNTNAAGVDQGTQRPSWVHKESAHCSLKSAYKGFTSTPCIDESAYKTAVNYDVAGAVGYGNIERNSLFGPGFQFENASLFKDFPIGERMKIQFRSEAFNIFNHPSGANPVNPTSANLGFQTTGTYNGQSCTTSSCLTFPSGYGLITGVQSIPGSFSGARVLELTGKVIF
ncbi:MAG TPA: carboxypeptidase regulatory-like domain-containing protein [Terracidiphilus sp.]|nr:carboxypeptidase regulatory-like domain-containing protein [Terracidiphilus sp.]